MVAVRYVVQDLGACELLLCLHAGGIGDCANIRVFVI